MNSLLFSFLSGGKTFADRIFAFEVERVAMGGAD